jgi:hypothetical protein
MGGLLAFISGMISAVIVYKLGMVDYQIQLMYESKSALAVVFVTCVFLAVSAFVMVGVTVVLFWLFGIL